MADVEQVEQMIYYDEFKAQKVINAGNSFFNVHNFDTTYLDGIVTNARGNTGAHYGEVLRHILTYLNREGYLPIGLSRHPVFQNGNGQMVQNIRLTETFQCYDFVRMVNINDKFHELSAKHISQNDGTNDDLIKAILVDLQRIYWKYKFNTDHPINLESAREDLRKVKCCEAIVFISEKTSESEKPSSTTILKRFSARVDGRVRMNHMRHFGELFQILNTGAETIWPSLQLVLGSNEFNKQIPYVSFFSGSVLCESLAKVSNLLDMINFCRSEYRLQAYEVSDEHPIHIDEPPEELQQFPKDVMEVVMALAKEEARMSITENLKKLDVVKHDRELLNEMKETLVEKTTRLRRIRFSPY